MLRFLQKMFVVSVKFAKVVRYIHEIILIKHMLNQTNFDILFVITACIRYNRDRYNRVRLYFLYSFASRSCRDLEDRTKYEERTGKRYIAQKWGYGPFK